MTLATDRKGDKQKVALRALAGHAARTLSSGAPPLYSTGNGSGIKRKGTRA